MKKRSNREAYEKRKGRINSAAMTQAYNKEENSPVSVQTDPPETLEERTKKTAENKQSADIKERTSSRDTKVPNAPGHKAAKKRKSGTGKAVVIGIVVVILAIALFAALYSTFGGNDPLTASFTFNSATATIGNEAVTMDNSVYEEDGTAMAPLNGIGEILPVTVKMKEGDDKATVKGNGVKLKFTVGDPNVEVNGESEEWPAAAVVKDGVVYVPLVAFCHDFGYKTAYAASISRVYVFTDDSDNKAPTATLTTDKDTYEVGETVTYQAEAEDPDGDEIVEWTWENHQEYFEEPGEVTITLTVMDDKGAVSDPVSKTITIVEPEPTYEEPVTQEESE